MADSDDVLPVFDLGEPGPMRDSLVAAVVAGEKRATSSLRLFYEMDAEPLPRPGERFALVESAGQRLGTVQIVKVDVLPLGDVEDDIAHAEGEGFTDAAQWRRAHEEFWAGYIDDLRSYLNDPGWNLDDDTAVVVEHFRLLDD